MHFSNYILGLVFSTLCITLSPSAIAQQAFQPSSKHNYTDFIAGSNWQGKHRFDNVFCLQFPDPANAKWLGEVFYNRNSLYSSQVAYNYADLTAIYVVASMIPEGTSAEVELDNLERQNRSLALAQPSFVKAERMNGVLGPSLTLTLRNSRDGDGKQTVFPFSRSIFPRPDGSLASVSVHRLLTRGIDRIEIAGLRYFKSPVSAEREAEAISALTALVDEAANTLQTCTVSLPPRVR